jgi:anti-sigma regulatory factor (Ser/Thr protein kinase)
MDEVTLQVDPDINAPSLSRSYLQPLRAKLGARYDDVALIVSELVSNSVKHAGANANPASIDVNVTVRAGKIRVEVADEGPGFAIDDARGDARGDGLGLAIVEKLADQWGTGPGRPKFVVWAELSAIPSG